MRRNPRRARPVPAAQIGQRASAWQSELACSIEDATRLLLGERDALTENIDRHRRAFALPTAIVAGIPFPPPHCLRGIIFPPIERLRELNIPMAVSTDCNPGASPIASLLAAMNMACVMFRMTAAEALRGATVNAAKALGLANDRGMLEVGARADLAVWRIRHPATTVRRESACSPVEIVLAR